MVELVWDLSRVGTATAPSGTSLTVGDNASVSPSDLLAMAVAGCHMRTFLDLAGQAGVPVLSYAATAHVEADATPAPRVDLRVFVVSSGAHDHARIAALVEQAARVSPVARALGDRVRMHADVHLLTRAATG